MRLRLLHLVLIALGLMACLSWVGARLTTPAAPFGIVSFELARTGANANTILASWDARAQRHAAFSLGFDYLFMVAYGAAIASACSASGRWLTGGGLPLAGVSSWLASAAWIAAGFDAIENFALSTILLRGTAFASWPATAWYCAVIKFALLFLALVFIFYAGAARLIAHRKR